MQWLDGGVAETSVALLPGGPGVDVTLGSREGQLPARLIVQCEPQPAAKLTDPQARNDSQEQAIAQLRGESSTPVSVLFANGALQQPTFDVIGPTRRLHGCAGDLVPRHAQGAARHGRPLAIDPPVAR